MYVRFGPTRRDIIAGPLATFGAAAAGSPALAVHAASRRNHLATAPADRTSCISCHVAPH